MLKNKVYVWLLFGLMFGLVLGMPLKGAGDVVVGLNHWTHDRVNNVLEPTNGTVDLNLSCVAGDNITWDAVDMEFDVSADGTSKWNDNGVDTLFTKTNGRDVQLNSSLWFNDDYEFLRQAFNGNTMVFQVDDAANRDFVFRNVGAGDVCVGINVDDPFFPLEVSDGVAVLLLESESVLGDGMAGIKLDTPLRQWIISNENAYNNDLLFRDVTGSRDCMWIENETGDVYMKYNLSVIGNASVSSLTTVNAVDMVINGDFDTDSDWDKGDWWTVDAVDKRAEFSANVLGYSGELNPTVPLSVTAGKAYQISFDVNMRRCRLVASMGGEEVFNTTVVGAPGGVSYSIDTAIETSTTDNLVFNATVTTAGPGAEWVYVDNVEVYEVGSIEGYIVAKTINLIGNISLPNSNSQIGSDGYGVSQIFLDNSNTVANVMNEFKGFTARYADGDMYVGNDNVFPGFYGQKTVTHDSNANSNDDDITNLYQGNTNYPNIGMMFGIEESRYAGNVIIGDGLETDENPCPLVFARVLGTDKFKLFFDAINDTFILNSTTTDYINISIKEDGALRPQYTNHTYLGTATERWKTMFGVDGDLSGDLDVLGDVLSNNVFIPAYLRTGSRSTIAITVGSQWENITFNHSSCGLCEGFSHTYDDATNDTFTVNDSGVYRVTYSICCEDSAVSPDAHVGFRLMNATAQTIIKGSYGEFDTSKKDEYIFKEHSFITSFNASNQFKVQFTSDDTTVILTPHVTFNPSGPSCQISINKIANL